MMTSDSKEFSDEDIRDQGLATYLRCSVTRSATASARGGITAGDQFTISLLQGAEASPGVHRSCWHRRAKCN